MRKLLALFLIVVLVFPLILATLALISVSSWALDRSFYTNLLGDTRLYEVLLSEDLPIYFNRQIAREVDSLPVGALSNALREVVTPQYLRDEALRIVNDAFDALEGRGSAFNLYLDVQPIKTALQGDGGRRFAQKLAASLPTCAASQEPVAPGGTLVRCLPSSVSVDQAASIITTALPTFLDKIPNQIDLSRDQIDLRRDFRGSEFWMGLVGTDGLNLAIVVMVFIAGSFWLVAALIAGEDRRQRLQWLGWSLIVPAILIFLIGMAINSGVAGGWVRFGLNDIRFNGIETSLAFQQALFDVAAGALNTIANGFLATGAVSGAIALALIAWGAATRLEPHMAPPMMAPGPMAMPPATSSQPAPQPQPQPPAQTPGEPPASSAGPST
jgi:hypothetical protein